MARAFVALLRGLGILPAVEETGLLVIVSCGLVRELLGLISLSESSSIVMMLRRSSAVTSPEGVLRLRELCELAEAGPASTLLVAAAEWVGPCLDDLLTPETAGVTARGGFLRGAGVVVSGLADISKGTKQTIAFGISVRLWGTGICELLLQNGRSLRNFSRAPYGGGMTEIGAYLSIGRRRRWRTVNRSMARGVGIVVNERGGEQIRIEL